MCKNNLSRFVLHALNQRSPARSGKVKGNNYIAKGKRSDTLGFFVCLYPRALKGQKRIAQGKRSGTLGINRT